VFPEAWTKLFWDQPGQPLLFTQGAFAVLFLLFWALYLPLRRQVLLRTLYVTAFSLFFYYKNSGLFVGLLLFTALWDHGLGLLIHASHDERKRKLWVSFSVLTNLGLLGYFKYSGLLLRTAQALSGHDVSAADLLVPVGLSFFTFQSLSYTIDIYRRKLAPVDNVLDFLFFVSFFPHLVAGPIVRAADFLPQVRKNARLTADEMNEAFLLLASGLFKKVIVADTLARSLVDPVFDNPLRHSAPECALAILGYSFQIYGDFSGYTDLALGLALLMGFRLCENFDQPYRALSLTEFWRRWHMSLSKWLRDYLYIPLGGNRGGVWRTYLNLMLTMLLGGLWHGASWRFMGWGGLHGAGLALERAMGLDAEVGVKGWKRALRVGVTFSFVTLAWVLFRAESLGVAGQLLRQARHATDWQLWQDVLVADRWLMVLMAFGVAQQALPLGYLVQARAAFGRLALPLRSLALALFFLIVWQFQGAGAQPFIYFQF
jgi:D-alanyl-lipoteichoic acid acyltransferase DltB (MBOAT superfamily)